MFIKVLLILCFFNRVMAGELTLCEYGSVVEVCKNKQITKVEIPKEVTYIADFAFSGCSGFLLRVFLKAYNELATNLSLLHGLKLCLFLAK